MLASVDVFGWICCVFCWLRSFQCAWKLRPYHSRFWGKLMMFLINSHGMEFRTWTYVGPCAKSLKCICPFLQIFLHLTVYQWVHRFVLCFCLWRSRYRQYPSINHDATVDPHEVLDFECHGELVDSCGIFSMCLIVSVSRESLLIDWNSNWWGPAQWVKNNFDTFCFEYF